MYPLLPRSLAAPPQVLAVLTSSVFSGGWDGHCGFHPQVQSPLASPHLTGLLEDRAATRTAEAKPMGMQLRTRPHGGWLVETRDSVWGTQECPLVLL